MARKRYTPEEDKRIRFLFGQGRTDEEIAAALGRGVPGLKHHRARVLKLLREGPQTREWSDEEIEIVKAQIALGKRPGKIALLLPGRTASQVGCFAKLRLNHGSFIKRWTPEEDVILAREFYAYRPRNEIADMLGRSGGVIQQRIWRLKLTRDRRRAKLVSRFPHLADDPRPVDEIREQLKAAEKTEQAERTAAEKEVVAQALAEMEQEIGGGGNRRAAFQKAMLAGATLQEVGDICGITRERVRQIVHAVLPADAFTCLVNRLLKLTDRDYARIIQVATQQREALHDDINNS